MPTTENNILILVIAVTCLLLVLTIFMTLTVIVYNKRKRKILLEKELLQKKYQEEILLTQLEIQEQTLKTISEEIHDNIGQVLSLAKLKLNTLDHSKQEELKEKISDSKNLVSKAIQDLRDLSRSMNTDNIASLGLLRAVEIELDMIRKSGFDTRLDVTGPPIKMEPQKELIIFRIVQETLNNIIKHAAAKSIMINAIYHTDKLELSITDNGKGVDLAPFNNNETTAGLGIRNMHNRAKMIGAEFNMSSTMGSGTVIKLIIPYTYQTV